MILRWPKVVVRYCRHPHKHRVNPGPRAPVATPALTPPAGRRCAVPPRLPGSSRWRWPATVPHGLPTSTDNVAGGDGVSAYVYLTPMVSESSALLISLLIALS